MGKTIENIKVKKDKITITFDDGEELLINEDIFSGHYLYKGKVIGDKEYNSFRDEIRLSVSYNYVLRLLANKMYFRKEILDKLLNVRKISFYEAQKVIKRLEDNHLINDTEYGKEYVLYLENKGYGFSRIERELKEKNVSPADVEFVYDEDNEYEKALRLLPSMTSKFKHYSYKKMSDSIYSSYIGLGYSPEIIKKVMASLNKDDYGEDELEKLRKDYIRMTVRMDEKTIKEQKDKLIAKLLRKGYRISDIIMVIKE